MVLESSVSGLFRTILLVIGAIVLLRFLGQLMNAKRNLEEEKKLKEAQIKFEKDLQKAKSNFGKTSILSENSNSKKSTSSNSPIEDVDYEEIS